MTSKHTACSTGAPASTSCGRLAREGCYLGATEEWPAVASKCVEQEGKFCLVQRGCRATGLSVEDEETVIAGVMERRWGRAFEEEGR
jgi:hypothetical protein